MAIPYSRTIVSGLSWYGMLVVLGIGVAVWLAGKEEKRLGLPVDTAVDLALVLIPTGVLGARLYYALMSWDQFADNPLSILYLWEGGLAIYGGVIGGALGAWVYARRKKRSFAAIADMIAPGLLLAQAIGRWGNYFNMEAYGPEITHSTLQFFPLGVLIPTDGGYVWHMATFFYESMWNLAGFLTLWMIRKRQRQQGNVFCWYLVIYGSGRFIIEQLRQDSLYVGGLRASQWLSLVLCAAAAVVLLYRTAQERRRFVLGGCCTILWLIRWACLNQTAAYGLIMLVAGVGAIWFLRNRRSLRLFVCMLALDALGLLLSMTSWPMMGYLHALLCSLTLPGSLLALCMKED